MEMTDNKGQRGLPVCMCVCVCVCVRERDLLMSVIMQVHVLSCTKNGRHQVTISYPLIVPAFLGVY